jgi:hypothetical protein
MQLEAMAMANINTQDILEKVIQAHGGAGRWQKLAAVEAVISVRGFLFTAKRRPVLKRVRVRAFTREPRFIFYDFPRDGQTGELNGDMEVRISGPENRTVSSRMHPRAAMRSLRRQLYWDDLDFTYFGGYATWNYLLTPFLFLREGFNFTALEPLSGIDLPFRLQVKFPEDLPTHCKEQIFHFDRNYLLRRLDYTAEVVGRWAHAAHLCENYRDFEGVKIPTTRRVRPIVIGSRPLPGPTIVAIDIHEFRLLEDVKF